MKKMMLAMLFAVSLLPVMAQQAAPKAPELDYVMQLKVKIDAAYTVGDTPHGRRVIIPITGGTFEGPAIKGKVLSGGADYQLASADGHRTELEAIYSIQTDDGVYIHVRNCGIIATGKDSDGHPSFYFKAAPRFEAPTDSRYAWLNDAIYVCSPDWSVPVEGTIVLNVWKVR